MSRGNEASQSDSGEHAEDGLRVVYVARDGDGQDDLQDRFDARREAVDVVAVADCSAARTTARAADTACIVVERLADCCREEFADEETPVILFTEADVEGEPDEYADVADTIVEQGFPHSVDFLAEKIRSLASVADEGAQGVSQQALELTAAVGRESLSLFFLDESGEILGESDPFAEVFPVEQVPDEPPTGTFWERLAALAAGAEERDGVTETLATDRQLEPASGALLAIPTPDGVRYYRRFSFQAESEVGYPDEVARIEAIQDVTDVTDQTEQLRLFQVLAEEARDALAVVDKRGRLEYVNQSLSDMLGYDRETLTGAHASFPMAEGELKRGQSYVQKLIEGDDPDSLKYELTYLTADGTEREIGFHSTLRSDGDEYTGLITVMRDVTERKERERRLEQFASVLSHDLRNPLSVAQGRATLLAEDADLSEEAQSHLDQITTQLDRMAGLVDDVLTLAQEGGDTGETTDVCVNTVAEEAWGNVETSGASLDCRTNRRYLADRSRLLQILENLFRNAVEHGGETVAVEIGDLDDADGFYVADDGPGIPESIREDVFDHGFTTRNDGTGFGLSIVQQLADAHGWTVALTESNVGGARFEFSGVTVPT